MINDKHGNTINVGSMVRVIHIDPGFLSRLPDDERDDIASMLNDVFEVYEIDEHNQAWVRKEWQPEVDYSMCHSLGLASEEMELV